MNTKAWMQTWRADPGSASPGGLATVVTGGTAADDGWHPRAVCQCSNDETASLIAAAPAMVRALLAVEWSVGDPGRYPMCQECAASQAMPGDLHMDDCAIDSALSAAGFPTQDSRIAARLELNK